MAQVPESQSAVPAVETEYNLKTIFVATVFGLPKLSVSLP